MSTLVIGSPSDKKGISVSPSKIVFNGNNVKKMMKGDTTIWINEIRALIPTMTSSNTPSGEVTQSDNVYYTMYGWHAFDGDDSTQWGSTDNGSVPNAWVAYNFMKKVIVKKAMIVEENHQIDTAKFQASNDGSSWVDITDVITLSSTKTTIVEIDNDTAYQYYRFHGVKGTSTSGVYVRTIQLYGY